jgi:peroxiredoxin
MRHRYLIIFLSLLCLLARIGQGQDEIKKAPEIFGKVWFNAGAYKKLNMKALRGKVVLLFFCSINDAGSANAVATLNDWYRRYKEKDFEIIGINTSDEMFGLSESDLYQRIEALGIRFPVVLDDERSLWQVYGQEGWPSFVLVDRKGFIRGQMANLVSYKDMETMLVALLEEGESTLFKRRDEAL